MPAAPFASLQRVEAIYSRDWADLMPAVLVAAVPILILFMLFAKKVVNSIGFPGVK